MFPFLAVVAQYILPELIKAITDSTKVQNSEQIKGQIDGAVRTITKADTPTEAEQKIKSDPALQSALAAQIAQISLDAKKVDAEADKAFNDAAADDTAGARQTLLKLLNEPESKWVALTPSIISYIVVAGFLMLVGCLIFGNLYFPTNPTVLQIVNICIGAIAAGFATVLNFWLGSSLGSRRKDAAIALTGTVDNVKTLTETKPASPPPTNVNLVTPPSETKPTTPAAPKSVPASLGAVGRSTDPSTLNVRSDVPVGPDKVPASIRYNNPGAQYPSRAASKFGQTGFGVIGGKHLIARFPSPVNGAAANLDLLNRRYVNMSIGEAGQKWTGNNGFGVPNYDANLMITKEMLSDETQAVGLLKEIAKREAGRQPPLTDEQWHYAFAMYQSGSADTFLAQFGKAPTTAVNPVVPDGGPNRPLEHLLAKALDNAKMDIAANPGEINIVYVEGMNEDGSPNNDAANKFNDLRCIIDIQADGTPRMLGKWQATTEPGYYYDRDHPINLKGAARIKFGQYKAWQVGKHRQTQVALVQCADVTVHRDLNRDMQRTGDAPETGLFGINQHGGYDLPADDIGKASAGCLVGRLMDGHTAFMKIVMDDPRYLGDAKFVFTTAIFPASDVVDAFAPAA